LAVSGTSILNAVTGAAFLGAALARIVAAGLLPRPLVGIWNARGEVCQLDPAGSFLTAARMLPPAAAPQLRRLAVAGSIFFALVFVGLAAGFLAHH
jgi:hypothetical protein